jgi:hypothetical protein
MPDSAGLASSFGVAAPTDRPVIMGVARSVLSPMLGFEEQERSFQYAEEQ